ncbi:MAG: tetratricopeptide repeat protein [Legionellales bacterium]
MKYIITTIILFISLNACAQQISYKDWQAEAKKDNRLLPEYGGSPRTKEQQAEDETYIKTATEEMQASRHDGSEQLVVLGFKYLSLGDPRVAMYRFNQAWLLDPNNANVYTGFGTVYFMFQDFKKSIKYYDKGLVLDPKNTNLLTYKARTYLSMYESATDTTAFTKTLPLLKKSYTIDPKNPYTTYMLSRYYIRLNDCDSSLKYYHECKKEGGQPITEQYEHALKKRCNIKD